MIRTISKIAIASSLACAALSAPVWAATPEDCQRAVDEVSVSGRANYDTALEAQMTKYLNAANTALMQKQSAPAMSELKAYEQKLNEAIQAKKIDEKDGATLKDRLQQAMKCVGSLK
ncbi:MAG: hypothetical protein IAE88_04620 [Rhodobacteraceae bacterium]|uniref:hypothetical protein n=1 Tax=Accumulibacter sp. TaxID=2053492 RepID=UPI0019E98D4C|nr:hypothetical protein [Accumulibacter sp.]MBE2258115.1 hypothetical protein [Paracoccaceae bacterium]MCB1944088.1 hypothetical protein [Accumulibacter sp.]